MSSHSYYTSERDSEQVIDKMDFLVTALTLFIIAAAIFACGYFVGVAQSAAIVSEALSK